MTIRFVEEAQREFLDAISFYEEARSGLGRQRRSFNCPGLRPHLAGLH